ncbi:tetrameric acyl-CoA thioesterase [Mangrovactinospora gilvigrisea]|uniref:Tetrameric acyl-CoA thioesterase n=1 Tax=Mangrovactinospora gilvigrisea TaxID=1428644 RepID=A0A1J7BC02_9ACTN|nr:YiiD C-terminal domain-containing protein [Mangrovactinospora gilvigrisea]OIV36166.1 tetrameric acyl-CoA thioesterase [Mangrovactinospora gilvigrisea]
MAVRRIPARAMRLALNVYPPFLGAGVRVVGLSEDYRHARVRLRLGRFNRNHAGTQFGGSLYSMTDPFWGLMVLHNLGTDHIVWDKAAEIEYVAPGRGPVYADFRLTEDRLAEIRSRTADGEKALVWFDTEVVAADGTVVARVRKQVYARRKPGR